MTAATFSTTFFDHIQVSSYSVLNELDYLASFSAKRFKVVDQPSPRVFKIKELEQLKPLDRLIRLIIQAVVFPLTILAIVLTRVWRWRCSLEYYKEQARVSPHSQIRVQIPDEDRQIDDVITLNSSSSFATQPTNAVIDTDVCTRPVALYKQNRGSDRTSFSPLLFEDPSGKRHEASSYPNWPERLHQPYQQMVLSAKRQIGHEKARQESGALCCFSSELALTDARPEYEDRAILYAIQLNQMPIAQALAFKRQFILSLKQIRRFRISRPLYNLCIYLENIMQSKRGFIRGKVKIEFLDAVIKELKEIDKHTQDINFASFSAGSLRILLSASVINHVASTKLKSLLQELFFKDRTWGANYNPLFLNGSSYFTTPPLINTIPSRSWKDRVIYPTPYLVPVAVQRPAVEQLLPKFVATPALGVLKKEVTTSAYFKNYLEALTFFTPKRAQWEFALYRLFAIHLGQNELSSDSWIDFSSALDSIRNQQRPTHERIKCARLLYTLPLHPFYSAFFKTRLAEKRSDRPLHLRISDDISHIESIDNKDRKNLVLVHLYRLMSTVIGGRWDPVGQVGNLPYAIGKFHLRDHSCTILRVPSPVVKNGSAIEVSEEFKAFIHSLDSRKESLLYICLLNFNKESENSIIRAIEKVSVDYPKAMHFVRMPMNTDLMTNPLKFGSFEEYCKTIEKAVLDNSHGFFFPPHAHTIVTHSIQDVLSFAAHLHAQEKDDKESTDAESALRQTLLLTTCVILKHLLISRLKVDYCNSTCKDGIDRGAVHLSSDLLWHAMLSGQLAQIEDDILYATYWPAMMAKGWAINHEHREKLVHFAKLIIDKYLPHADRLKDLYKSKLGLEPARTEFFSGDELMPVIAQALTHRERFQECGGDLRTLERLVQHNHLASSQHYLENLSKSEHELHETFTPDPTNHANAIIKQYRRDLNHIPKWVNGQELKHNEDLLNQLNPVEMDPGKYLDSTLGFGIPNLKHEEMLLILQCASQTIMSQACEAIWPFFQLPALHMTISRDPSIKPCLRISYKPAANELGHVDFEWHMQLIARSQKDANLKELAKIAAKVTYRLDVAAVRQTLEQGKEFPPVPLKVTFKTLVTSSERSVVDRDDEVEYVCLDHAQIGLDIGAVC